MPDLEIKCLQCQETFSFNEKDQELFYRRNQPQPQRCNNCRPANKKTDSKGILEGAKPPRYEITCDRCGKVDYVPFVPKIGRAVLCKDCHGISLIQRPRKV
ncbi:MAG: zinc-ribbon domain containing protein [Pyrinomonadaceae bacterium]|nr:zinc-ribbon domain containing protein [Pyrinomonadaceae bacterium]